jgi:predicted alpha/beta superfamily hydrolase
MSKLNFLGVCFILIVFTRCNIDKENRAITYYLEEIPAPSLENNLVGTENVQQIGVYLPPSYNYSAQLYPVVYFLNGYTVEAGEYPKTEAFDAYMKNNNDQEFILIELNGYNLFEGSMYANSVVAGNWEDYIVKDVVTYVDNNYRTLGKRESRGIAGHSMGGGGTINISLKYPDVFSVAYAMSPAVLADNQLISGTMANDSLINQILTLSERMANVKDDQFAETLKRELEAYDRSMTGIYGFMAFSTAFAPDPAQPLKIALPFERDEKGNLRKIDENYNRLISGFGNLEGKVERYKDNLLKYNKYALDCGLHDEMPGLFKSAVYFSQILTKAEIPHSTHWYDGNHSGKVSEQLIHEVFPAMSTYLLHE